MPRYNGLQPVGNFLPGSDFKVPAADAFAGAWLWPFDTRSTPTGTTTLITGEMHAQSRDCFKDGRNKKQIVKQSFLVVQCHLHFFLCVSVRKQEANILQKKTAYIWSSPEALRPSYDRIKPCGHTEGFHAYCLLCSMQRNLETSNYCGTSRTKRVYWVHDWLKKLTEWHARMIAWIHEWMHEWLAEWLNDWVTEWLNDWVTEWLTEWRKEWRNEWRKEWMEGWMKGWRDEWWMINGWTD